MCFDQCVASCIDLRWIILQMNSSNVFFRSMCLARNISGDSNQRLSQGQTIIDKPTDPMSKKFERALTRTSRTRASKLSCLHWALLAGGRVWLWRPSDSARRQTCPAGVTGWRWVRRNTEGWQGTTGKSRSGNTERGKWLVAKILVDQHQWHL